MPPSALFMESSAKLGSLTRLQGGWSPSAPAQSGVLDGLLAKIPGSPQAAAARGAEIYRTLQVTQSGWGGYLGRNEVGEREGGMQQSFEGWERVLEQE